MSTYNLSVNNCEIRQCVGTEVSNRHTPYRFISLVFILNQLPKAVLIRIMKLIFDDYNNERN